MAARVGGVRVARFIACLVNYYTVLNCRGRCGIICGVCGFPPNFYICKIILWNYGNLTLKWGVVN